MVAAGIHDNQRFGHQIGQVVDCAAGRLCCIRNHCGSGLDREAAGKDAERIEKRLLVPIQQAVTPIDDGPHGPMPRHGRAAAWPQQLEAVVETGNEAFDPQHLDARRGELDGQRQAVEPAADLGDRRSVRIGQREVFDNRACTFDEQLHGGESCRLLGR